MSNPHSNIVTMKTRQPSPIALAILALLYEAPMHPYRMQKLIKERGKDTVINVRQRASLYQTIKRLSREQLIRVKEVAGEGNLPERTVYELTNEGRQTAVTWMREMLSEPAREFPQFPAALAYLPLLTPDDVLAQLRARSSALEGEIRDLKEQLQKDSQFLPRLFLLESEYLLAAKKSERDWVQGIVRDLDSGQITWSEEYLRALAQEFSNEK